MENVTGTFVQEISAIRVSLLNGNQPGCGSEVIVTEGDEPEKHRDYDDGREKQCERWKERADCAALDLPKCKPCSRMPYVKTIPSSL